MNRTSALPLNIGERKELANVERQISKLQEELVPDEGDEPDGSESRKKDLILTESLRILADLVALGEAEAESEAAEVVPPDEENNWWRRLGDLFGVEAEAPESR
jgi:hypothetical protein